jgi:mono/diheme cytochrome c family protein
MRYLLLLFILLVVATVARFGTRGNTSRKPALYLFGDMDRQPKLRPQADSPLFPDGRTSRLPPPGTIARSEPVVAGSQEVYPFEDNPVNTGRVPGTTNYVELNPLPITDRLMSRGQERFNIYCAPCHGPAGDGKSAVSKLGMGVIADLHDTKTRRVVQQTDGQLFETITFGRNLMGAYGGIIPVEDRWAIVAYVRALQRSRLATTEDIPQNERLRLPGGTAPPPQPATAPAQPAAPPKPQ